MRTGLALAGLTAIAPGAWAASGWELTLLGGWTAPTLEERVLLDVELDLPEVPGVSFEQEGEFALVGAGSFAFGGSVAYFFNDHVAVEARVDTVDFQVDTEGPRITGALPIPPPLPSLDATLDLSEGALNVERLYPLSASVKVRTGAPVGFVASAGVSFLPRLRFAARQVATIGVSGALIGNLPLARAAVEVEALSDVPTMERFGFNGGAGVEARLSDRLSFIGEARVFAFPTQTLSWRASSTPGSDLEELLLQELLAELEEVELELTYFQISGGLVLRF